MAFAVDSQGQVYGFIYHMVILPNFNNNTIKVNNRIDIIQWSVLPGVNLINHCVGHFGNKSSRNLCIVHLFECCNDITGGHTFCIKRQDLVIELG